MSELLKIPDILQYTIKKDSCKLTVVLSCIHGVLELICCNLRENKTSYCYTKVNTKTLLQLGVTVPWLALSDQNGGCSLIRGFQRDALLQFCCIRFKLALLPWYRLLFEFTSSKAFMFNQWWLDRQKRKTKTALFVDRQAKKKRVFFYIWMISLLSSKWKRDGRLIYLDPQFLGTFARFSILKLGNIFYNFFTRSFLLKRTTWLFLSGTRLHNNIDHLHDNKRAMI